MTLSRRRAAALAPHFRALSATTLVAVAALSAAASAAAQTTTPPQRRPAGATGIACDEGNGGLKLPDGFCAVVVGKNLGPVRQLVVAPNGDLYAALSGGSSFEGRGDGSGTGGVLAFRDSNGDGKPDEHAAFGPGGGNDVKLHGDYIYYALDDRIVRWKLTPGKLEPQSDMETVVTDLPADGNHTAKSLAFVGNTMYVNLGSATNSCQEHDRKAGSKGLRPCTELEHRAGVWTFAADRAGQTLADGKRFATGARNAEALAIRPGTGELWVAVNGRDQLADNWGYSAERSAENPGEEVAQLNRGDDLGWPYCYYDTGLKQKVLAPEYGGDGKTVGECAAKKPPAIVLPAHYAPLALAFYPGDTFGAAFRGGAFIALHGSWNRAPLPAGGYQVAFISFADGKPTAWNTFATGETTTALRASGVAVAPDGTLYISGDRNGTIWRVTRR
jgi:glucose/arabinose dehydrogenase